VLPADGRLNFSDLTLEQLGQEPGPFGPTYQLASCATLVSAKYGYYFSVAPPCDRSLRVAYHLESPWENVVEVREHTEPDRQSAGWLIAASTFVVGITAAPFLLVGATSKNSALEAVGIALLAVGLGVDLLVLPTLLAPAHDRVVETPSR
jgi:hypothetical protein